LKLQTKNVTDAAIIAEKCDWYKNKI